MANHHRHDVLICTSYAPASEKAWFAAAAAADGPYSPRPGPASVTYGGGRLTFSRQHGVDLAAIDGQEEAQSVVSDRDGRLWFVRQYSGGFVFGFRDVSEEEMSEAVDRYNDAVFMKMPADQFRALRLLSMELSCIVEALRPERCVARSQRRQLKRRLQALTGLEFDLLWGESMGSASVRSRMSDLGMPMRQINRLAEDPRVSAERQAS